MSRISRILDRLESVLALGERVLVELAPGETDPSLFERHAAFRWDSGRPPGHLAAIEEPACFDLDDLIGVGEPLAALERNTRQLLGGHPYNNVLLHGERGTGKSSAVRGLLTRYAAEGLRVVEVDRADLVHLPRILAALRGGKRWSFLIFCDDLSFGPGEAGYLELKAALDGSLAAPPLGVCIVATSNRRSLVPQTMAENRAARVDEHGELHLGEALEEKLALADRFGLVLGFYNFDQSTYLAIVSHYLCQAGIAELDDELRRESLRWALSHASRSGRTARQFVDDVVGRLRLAGG
jgi:predicted AAA+ superfamily ATPase